MAEMSVGFARTMARKYLKKYGVKDPPVRVAEIVSAEGIKIAYVDYADDTSGDSWWEYGGGFMNVNRRHAIKRRRFTIAHELGHLVMGHHSRKHEDLEYLNRTPPGDEEEELQSVDPFEVQANNFAAELLMPTATFKKEWLADPRGETVPTLAARYKVSEVAAWWQIRGYPVPK